MNNIVIGILIVGIVFGIGIYVVVHQTAERPLVTTSSQGESREETKDTSASSSDFKGSFAELAERGGSYKCTFAHENDIAVSTGTVYISGDRIRGDFHSETEHMDVESHMIAKGGYVYTWSPMTSQGFKMIALENGGSFEGSAAMSGNYADLHQEYNYDCVVWNSDESMFTLPNDHTFVEMNIGQ